jgi:predicted ABC-type sugar transport system permease subunit
MLFFWYCVDEYFARLCNNPELGHVPWWVILVLSIIMAAYFVRSD